MPRAFLITNRRYNSAVEYESRENSPERCVWTAESDVQPELKAASPHSPATLPKEEFTVHREELRALDGLYQLSSLEQLAEISLATAAGHLHQQVIGRRSPPPPPPPPPPAPPPPLWAAIAAAVSGSNEESSSEDSNSGEIHICPECGKRYSTSSNLARHRQTHRSVSDKKARKCPHCDKVYVSMPAYSMHVRTHSQGCQCPYCGKCFSRPWLLQGHIRTHTGEKPFKCPVCNKAFADKSNLRAHIQTHSNTKPFVCQRCGKAFALKSYLYKHEESSCMRFHRPEKRSA